MEKKVEMYFCPKCRMTLNDQEGFDPEKNHWRCHRCGTQLIGDDVYAGDFFPEVLWYCDACGAFLNEQKGFFDFYEKWTCAKCGYSNRISEEEIDDGIVN